MNAPCWKAHGTVNIKGKYAKRFAIDSGLMLFTYFAHVLKLGSSFLQYFSNLEQEHTTDYGIVYSKRITSYSWFEMATG